MLPDNEIRTPARQEMAPTPSGAPLASGLLRSHGRLTRRGWAAAVALAVVLVVALGWLAGFRALTLASTSMSPWAEPGALVISRAVPVDALSPGDVVSIALADGRLVTHRVTSVERETDGGVVLRLRGDANAGVDPEPYPADGKALRAITAVDRLGGFLQVAAPLFWAGTGMLLLGWVVLRGRSSGPAPARRAPLSMTPAVDLEPTGDVHVVGLAAAPAGAPGAERGAEQGAERWSEPAAGGIVDPFAPRPSHTSHTATAATATPATPAASPTAPAKLNDALGIDAWSPPELPPLNPRIDALLATAEALVEDGMPWVVARDLVRVRVCDLLALPSAEHSGAVRALDDGSRFYVLALVDADPDALAVVPVSSGRRRAGTHAVERWWSAVDAAVPVQVLTALAPWLRGNGEA